MTDLSGGRGGREGAGLRSLDNQGHEIGLMEDFIGRPTTLLASAGPVTPGIGCLQDALFLFGQTMPRDERLTPLPRRA